MTTVNEPGLLDHEPFKDVLHDLAACDEEMVEVQRALADITRRRVELHKQLGSLLAGLGIPDESVAPMVGLMVDLLKTPPTR